MNREIPSSTLATLRGILVSSLSRENLGPHDLPVHEHMRHRPPRKVHFHEGKLGIEILHSEITNEYIFPAKRALSVSVQSDDSRNCLAALRTLSTDFS